MVLVVEAVVATEAAAAAVVVAEPILYLSGLTTCSAMGGGSSPLQNSG